jgi:uncharacterized SAM-binding protein YcdF (DUF218 family)
MIRTIEAAFYPVGMVWIFLTISAIVLFRKKFRGPAILCAFFSAFLFITGATPLPEFLLARLERPYKDANIATATPADAVIILGGFMNPSTHDPFAFNLTPSSDRLITGMELFRQGKAGAILIGGGAIGREEKKSSESALIEKFVKTWNLASGDVIALSASGNTFEEAMHAREILNQRHWTNVILVTSAYHMARSLATFQKAGIQVRPVACDFEGLPPMEGEGNGFRFIPIIDHLQNFTLYMHEVLGWYYYSFRGWV